MTDATELLQNRVATLERAASEVLAATSEVYEQCAKLTGQVTELARMVAALEAASSEREALLQQQAAAGVVHRVLMETMYSNWLAAMPAEAADAVIETFRPILTDTNVASGALAGITAEVARDAERFLQRTKSAGDALRAALQIERGGPSDDRGSSLQ